MAWKRTYRVSVGDANPAEITEYHVLSGLFLAADITAQQGEVLAINRCPYFHFGREKYLWGTDCMKLP